MSDATYLYCIVKAAKKPSLAKVPPGLPGCGKPRLLDAGKGLWLVVSDAPSSELGESAIARGLKDLEWVAARALAHERVVERFTSARAMVPAKLFTIFASDERAVGHVTRERARIERALKRVEGRLEWGVRLAFDEKRALADADARARKEAAGAKSGVKSGAAFLLRKKKVRDVVKEVSRSAAEVVDDAFDSLARAADDAVRRPIPASPIGAPRVLFDGAFLVAASKERKFKAEVKRLAEELRARGYDVSLTGPWPPYNFIADAA